MPGISDLLGAAGGGASLVGPALSLGTSVVQNLSAAKKKKEADSLMPGTVDPRQAAFLAELNQKRKSIDTGADFGAGMNALNATNASTNEAITRATGGDVGSTIQGLLGGQRAAGDSANNVLAQGQQQQMQYNTMFNSLNNKIADRAMQIQMQRSQQARAEWAQKKQSANQNFQAGLGGLLSGGAPKMATPSMDMGGGDMMQGNTDTTGGTGFTGLTGGDSANAPNLGMGGANPELMGSAASGQLDTSFLDNIGGK